MAAQCPMFASDEVRVYIKERETQTGKKIKWTLVIKPTGEVDKYWDPIGEFAAPLWENVNEDTGKVSWGCTYEKGICWISLHQKISDSGKEEYFLRVSYNNSKLISEDTSKDKRFGEDDNEPNMDLPF
jgi:hypothetical protein